MNVRVHFFGCEDFPLLLQKSDKSAYWVVVFSFDGHNKEKIANFYSKQAKLKKYSLILPSANIKGIF